MFEETKCHSKTPGKQNKSFFQTGNQETKTVKGLFFPEGEKKCWIMKDTRKI